MVINIFITTHFLLLIFQLLMYYDINMAGRIMTTISMKAVDVVANNCRRWYNVDNVRQL